MPSSVNYKILKDETFVANEMTSRPYTWRISSFLNLLTAVYAAVVAVFITCKYKTLEYLSLIDNFDGKNNLFIVALLIFLATFINMMGALYANKSLREVRRGVLKFTMYSYTCCLFVVTLMLSFSLYISLHSIYQISDSFKV